MFRERRGVTITETMMAGAIGAAMLGLLLPAISAAIANSQGSNCRNNLARLGVALNAYHDALGKFPPGMQTQGTPSLGAEQGDTPARGASWAVCLLPYINEQAVYNLFNFSRTLPGGLTNVTANVATQSGATGSTIYALRCPADTGFDTRYQVNRNSNIFNPNLKVWQYYGRSNYGANGCLMPPFNYGTSPPVVPACGGPDQQAWSLTSPYSWKTRGVMGYSASLSRAQITDGTTKTILLGDIRVGLTSSDPRGIWADGIPASGSAWFHIYGPNNCSISDDLNPGRAQALGLTLPSAVAQQQCMGFQTSLSGNASGHFRSKHEGGCFFLMCDGSVRFISSTVEVGLKPISPYAWVNDYTTTSGMGTWERLNASGDGLVLDDSTDANFSSTVVPYVFGDMNGDGVLDNFDISAFELALGDPAGYLALYPNLTDYQQRGDINQDGTFDNYDIGAFEALLTDLL